MKLKKFEVVELVNGNKATILDTNNNQYYAEIVNDVCAGLKGKVKSIVLAGYPKEQVEAYKAQGVDEFIHVKTNVLESLTAFQKMMNLL